MQNRPLRPFEQGAHLHVLDWTHSTVRHRFQAAGAVQVKAAAKAIVRETNMSHPPHLPALEASLTQELRNLYAVGHATVRSELDHQQRGAALPIGLSEAPEYRIMLALGDPDPGQLRARARLTVADVAHQIFQAVQRARLHGMSDKPTLRQIGRQAGNGALSVAASHHAGAAINGGRVAAANANAAIIGARYTSVLDKSTCGPCAAADTGELIPIGDPRWVPTPNPACLGGGRCRCIHVYQLASESAPGSLLPPDDFPAESRQPDRPSGARSLPVAQVGVGSS